MPASVTNDVAVVELRQYTLKPGQRDVLIDIFERHFIEPQEDVGMPVIGHFRDHGDPHRFVWLRGFRDMPSRKAALESFYGSDLWSEHRDAVNETLVDSDDVLLLRPVTGLPFVAGAPPSDQRGLVTARIWPFAEPISADIVRVFTDEIAPQLGEAGATLVALLVTEPSENDFPRLPIREGENVVVWLGRFDDDAAYEAHVATLERSPRWHELAAAIEDRLSGRPQTLRLAPAARSQLV
jgi:quinol monooxygenase YgiN